MILSQNFYLSLFLFVFSTWTFSQQIKTPVYYKVLIEREGDLDKDGIPEKVIVYNTSDTTEEGIVREIRIFKHMNTGWALLKNSKNAIMKSEEGGMMGDPFEDLEIIDGTIIINQSGGSSWKWRSKDIYRFQHGEFELIGHTSQYGKLCEYWANFNFNISTGNLIYKKEFESCENDDQKIYKVETETFIKKGITIIFLIGILRK